jgi:hypothetical protein
MEATNNPPRAGLDGCAVIELFGHTRIAGRVSDFTLGSAVFVRVEVPETKGLKGYTRLINPSAIYALNPCDEESMMAAAKQCSTSPVELLVAYDMREKVRAEFAEELTKLRARLALTDSKPGAGPLDDLADDDDDFDP